ncbi:DgyrCDS3556 [Dimorphilus gyrociliatus]|uniref:DgyrCDS3556 n=1 Tax=Dimorphilus gyrociliatus TaxID=2664684 RepID=A0A7I8VDJ3_9ANNE|nr:DgyrCDS3556 [Dimorphilus gyrociliatus]
MAAPRSDSMPKVSTENLEYLRNIVKQYCEVQELESALFWADKLVCLSSETPQDVYTYALLLYQTKQYYNCTSILESKYLEKKYYVCQLLVAKCYFEINELEKALNILKPFDSGLELKELQDLPGVEQKNVKSLIYLLLAKISEALEDRKFAEEYYKQALQHDVFCYEALHWLQQHNYLTTSQEKNLTEDLLAHTKGLTSFGKDLISYSYSLSMDKFNPETEIAAPDSVKPLSESLYALSCKAEKLYYTCQYKSAFKLLSKILRREKLYKHALAVFVSTLYELRKVNALFTLANKLVEVYPKEAISWYSIGVYYLLLNQIEKARKFLTKSKSLDKSYAPAWIAYGHSFAEHSEHDQAMAAYNIAARYAAGSHFPLLFMGMEQYSNDRNLQLASKYIKQAMDCAPNDPSVLHEMGVVLYEMQDYESAEKLFLEALSKIEHSAEDISVDSWEPLFSNLGHVYRRLK